MRGVIAGLALMMGLLVAGHVSAQGRVFVLGVSEELEETGVAGFLAPRFSLKHGIKVTREVHDASVAADAIIVPAGLARELVSSGSAHRPSPVFRAGGDGGTVYTIALVPDSANAEHAKSFRDWITSDIGQKTIAAFRDPDGRQPFLPGIGEVEEVEEYIPEGDIVAGEKLALFHCGRCHVVNEKNRMGGIGSTPSFGALRAIEDWQNRFLNFWQLNPHPSFTQVDGITEPFDPLRPPHIAPVEITMDEMEAIVAFAASIPPKDLGPEINMR